MTETRFFSWTSEPARVGRIPVSPRPRSKRARALIRDGGKLAIYLFEAYVLAEILWHTLHGESLRDAIAAYVEERRERIAYRLEVMATRNMIRRLPEE